ncbi:NUDIX hydrolase [Dysgonomonas sp. ZJ709]|uniref:NUDIX hydrolase n=1 Tax=Dysgonomonas sp. ZJ709 TaxID=2709797 RepID=UPI0013EE3E44|nr:NUDIX hydrolase [Dysgonomonas sp. ZJ709]
MKKDMLPSGISGEGVALYMPSVSVECVILGFHSGGLKVLLRKLKINDQWMLPGSLIAIDEDVDKSAQRTLYKRTGIRGVSPRQFYLFGRKDRADSNDHVLKEFNIEGVETPWYLQRFMSVGYYALVQFDQIKPMKSKENDDEIFDWFMLDSLPELYADHNKIIRKAIETVRMHIGYIPIGYKLLPEKFTMPELRVIYETILGKAIDRRNFQRKVLSVGLIEPLNETRKIGPHKSPILYSFDKKKYAEAEKNGIQFMSNNF